jgi:hypothetical protein
MVFFIDLDLNSRPRRCGRWWAGIEPIRDWKACLGPPVVLKAPLLLIGLRLCSGSRLCGRGSRHFSSLSALSIAIELLSRLDECIRVGRQRLAHFRMCVQIRLKFGVVLQVVMIVA